MTKRLPDWAQRGRGGWRWTGVERPPFAETPVAGQESVWDYPRPPALDLAHHDVSVRLGDTLIADTGRALRVLETSHPPTYYLPPEDVRTEYLVRAKGSSACEWKGVARYWDVRGRDGRREVRGAWSYDEPFDEFERLRGWFSFYPARFECRVGEALVRPQAGGFYGGWVTPDLAGPFKGEPGSAGW